MKLRRKNRRSIEDQVVDYWQSIADALTALLLAILLVVAVLILVIASNSGWLEGSYHNDGAGTVDVRNTDGGKYDAYGNGAHGGGDQGAGPWESDTSAGAGGGAGDYDDPDPGAGDLTDPIRAAVHVTVVDGESQQPIAYEGISFQLVSARGVHTLSTFYPQKVDYNQFATTPDGTFYLPQKVGSGTWQLVNLWAPDGYDVADPVEFEIRDDYDWTDPCQVTVELWPCRNVVRIQQVDAAGNAGVAGGAWDIVATQDVSTLDGTQRYAKDQVVATVAMDQAGYGQSEPLYLGSFRLQQAEYAAGYAAYQQQDGSLDLKVEKKQDGEEAAPLHTVTLHKTRYVVRLVDEETKNPLEGAQFVMEPGNVKATTNKDGVVSFDGLDKGASYVIAQLTTRDGYSLAQDIAFDVDAQGLIDGAPSVDVFVTNYVVRASVSVVGTVLRKPIAGQAMSLVASDGSVVRQWVSGASAEKFEGLGAGTYQLVGPDGAVQVTVQDKAGMQRIEYSQMTTYDIAALGGAAALALAAIAGVVVWLRRRRQS